MERRRVLCCVCDKTVSARLTTADRVYPNRPDLRSKFVWQCFGCNNHVGCHPNKSRTPLGVIVGPDVRLARMDVHRLLDPLWKTGLYNRRDLYAVLSELLGREYHTADLRTVDEARTVIDYLKTLKVRPQEAT